MLRRFTFVAITFALFSYPGIQIQVFIYTSVLYIIYISHMYFHDPKSSKTLEIFNESLFLLVGYHFVVFTNLLWDEKMRDLVGRTLVATTATILVLNTSIIIAVSIKAFLRKLYLWRLKRRVKK